MPASSNCNRTEHPPARAAWAMHLLGAVVALCLLAAHPLGWASDAAALSALRTGDAGIVLFRHAIAPGGGDPAGHRLGDCSTQRNLSADGRAQAKRIGAAFKDAGIVVGAVWTSQWCRTRDTADLAFPGQRVDQPVFNSFFNEAAQEPERTASARSLLNGWQGPGVLVVVTHQVNITALTGVVPGSGQGVVVKPSAIGLQVVGRIDP